MFNLLISDMSFTLSGFIEKEQWILFKVISQFLGYILNFVFNIVFSFTTVNSLGISIILFTIIARTLMLPMGFKQQKSMFQMKSIQPEIEKIKNKYGNSKDPEIQKKINLETQALYSKNKVNPLSGCLPLFITFPIFIALSYILRHSYLFVNTIDNIYNDIFAIVVQVENRLEILAPLVGPKIRAKSGIEVNTDVAEQLKMAFNVFFKQDWVNLIDGVSKVDQSAADGIVGLLAEKNKIENFFGIDLVEVAGWAFPGILIPIFSGLTTFLSSFIINKQSPTTDPSQKSQQMIMLIVMPLMMAFFTVSMSAGVGLYWTVGNIYQTIQQVLLNNYYKKRSQGLLVTDSGPKEIIEIKPSDKKGKKGVK